MAHEKVNETVIPPTSGRQKSETIPDSVNKVCYICLETLDKDRITTPCRHAYHKSCLTRLVKEYQKCACCRQNFPTEWLLENGLRSLTPEEYWSTFERTFDTFTGIGPLVPHQRRQFDAVHRLSLGVPSFWSSEWIEDKLAEVRMHFDIPTEFILTPFDLVRMENRGRYGIEPIWETPTWYRSTTPPAW